MIADFVHALAAALAAKAQNAPFSQEITAAARYLPQDDLAVQTGIKVYVAPSSIDCEQLIDVPERVALLGTLEHKGQTREVFLVCGMARPDASTVLAGAKRLAATGSATVLCVRQLPPAAARPAAWRTVLALAEIVAIRNGRLSLPTVRLFEEQFGGVRETDTAGPVLCARDLTVLQALNERPGEPILITELAVASGYGRDAVMEAMKVLSSSGLAERPVGSQRKGFTITGKGRRFVGRLPETARS